LIADLGLPGVRAINGGPAPENTTAEIRQLSPSLVIIVDAAAMGEEPGTIRLIDPWDVGGASFGTHGLPLTVLAGYLRTEIGCEVIIIGIQPASAEYGEELSTPVADAAEELVEALTACLGGAPGS
jgi:hydrogenase 3 maturation protease